MKSILSFLYVVLFFVFAGPVNGFAQDILTVSDITVDVTADNAIEARKQAFEQAQRKAFNDLLVRLLEEEEAQSFAAITNDDISTLVQDFEVTNERLSAVRYVGTYTFRFDAIAVRRLFTTTGHSYTTAQSKPLLILPFYKKHTTPLLWSPANMWMQAWATAKNHSPLVPLVVPLGDLNDIRDIDETEHNNFNPAKLNRMLERYSAGEAVILYAEADDALSAVSGAKDSAQGTLTVTMLSTDRGIAEQADRFSIEAKPEETYASLLTRAVLQVQTKLTKEWKKQAQMTPGQISNLDINIPITSLRDWTDVRTTLLAIPQILDISLKSLRPSIAMVKMEFQGNVDTLSLILEQNNFKLLRENIDYTNPSTDYKKRAYIIVRKQFDSPNVRSLSPPVSSQLREPAPLNNGPTYRF